MPFGLKNAAQAFQRLMTEFGKDFFLHSSTLTPLPTRIVADASDVSVGAALQQQQPYGLWRPLAFLSGKLDQAQKNTAPLIGNSWQSNSPKKTSSTILREDVSFPCPHRPQSPYLCSPKPTVLLGKRVTSHMWQNLPLTFNILGGRLML